MNRRYIWLLAIVVAILTIPLVVPPASAQAADAPWPQFRQNEAHTGEGQGTAPTYMVLNWKFPTGGPVQSSPSIVGGKIYFGSMDKYWYCLNAQTGAQVWKFKTNWKPQSSAAVVDGKVYTGADDGNVYCLDANNGTQIWKAVTDGGLLYTNVEVSPWQIRGSPCVVGGRVYVGHLDNKVYCIDATTGAIVWKYATGQPVASSPAVVNNRVYIGSGDNYMYCLNANNGSLVWRFRGIRPGETVSRGLGGGNSASGVGGEDDINGSPTVVEGKIIFFEDGGDRFWCLDANTGNPVWLFWPRRQRYNYQNPRPLDIKVGGVHPGDQPGHDPIFMRTSASTYVTPAYHNGYLYLLEDFFMQRLELSTGLRSWAPYPGMLNASYTDYIGNATQYGQDPTKRFFNNELSIGFVGISSAMYADGKMYIGGNEQTLFCNDATTGKRYSWYETFGFVQSSPSLGYGNVYVGSQDWYMYCFKEGGATAYRKPGVGGRAALSISASLSASSVVLGTPLKITGSVNPAPTADPYKGAPCIIAYFTRPDGTVWEQNWHLKSNSFGWYIGDPTYEINYTPDMVGTWTVNVELHPMQFDPYQTSVTSTMTFTVVAGSSSPTTLQTTSALTVVSILAVPAVVAIPIAAVLHKRKQK